MLKLHLRMLLNIKFYIQMNFLQCHFVSEKIKNNFLKVKNFEMDFFISISTYFNKLDKQKVNKNVIK